MKSVAIASAFNIFVDGAVVDGLASLPISSEEIYSDCLSNRPKPKGLAEAHRRSLVDPNTPAAIPENPSRQVRRAQARLSAKGREW